MFSIKFRYFTIVLFVLFIHYKVADCCTCLPSHPQTQYCNSDFVIVIVPLNVSTFEDGIMYTVSIDKRFKVKTNAEDILQNNRIFTPPDSAACGVTLQLNEKYLIMGTISNGKASINSCGYVTTLPNVPKGVKKGVSKLYRRGCECYIEYCFSNLDCTSPLQDHVCRLNSPLAECYVKTAVCIPSKKSNRCTWKSKGKLQDCLAELSTNRVGPEV